MKNFQTFIFISLITIIFSISGCDAAYLPWNSGTRWNVGNTDGTDPFSIETNYNIAQAIELENFCDDNREFIDHCRMYVHPGYNWHRPRSSVVHRILYIQNLIDQYDSLCATR